MCTNGESSACPLNSGLSQEADYGCYNCPDGYNNTGSSLYCDSTCSTGTMYSTTTYRCECLVGYAGIIYQGLLITCDKCIWPYYSLYSRCNLISLRFNVGVMVAIILLLSIIYLSSFFTIVIQSRNKNDTKNYKIAFGLFVFTFIPFLVRSLIN